MTLPFNVVNEKVSIGAQCGKQHGDIPPRRNSNPFVLQ
jgi:hypothetical protein